MNIFNISEDNIKLYNAPSNNVSQNNDSFCKAILYAEVNNSGVRLWDLFLLIPTVLFFFALCLKLKSSKLKLRAVHSPIYVTFYVLIWANAVVALIRCVVSMTVNAATPSGGEADKILFVSVRFFLLMTEMSVVIFAIFFGHLDNKTSIRRVILVTSVIALPYAIIQGILELSSPDPHFYIPSKDFYVFSHGGSLFWLVSSIFFTLIYAFILILKLDCLRKKFLFLLWMPMKRGFYVYIGCLSMLNMLQCVGSGLCLATIDAGLCILDFTTWTYFSLLTPLIYYTFISEFLGLCPYF